MRWFIVGNLLGLISTVYAVGTTLCRNSICYSMSVPETSTSSVGTVYFQISGPTSLAWVAMGAGSRMTGAKMFIVYQSENGQNVTLSPRSVNGYEMPSVDDNIKISLLEGSGIFDDIMVANIRCNNCGTSHSSWVYAYVYGEFKSDSISAYINQHSTQGYMFLDPAAARGGNSTNPFGTTIAGGASGTGCEFNSGPEANSNETSSIASSAAASSSESPTSTAEAETETYEPGWRGGSAPTGRSVSRSNMKRQESENDCSIGESRFIDGQAEGTSEIEVKLMAHGIMASLAFAVLFPVGAISMRLFSFPGLIWFHAGLQIFTTAVFIAALVLGVQLASSLGLMNQYHPIIGIVLLALLAIQPVLGQMHHRRFKEHGQHTAWSHGHLWLGRIIITLGIINGGLGFLLAGNTTVGIIVYAVVAGCFYFAYLGAAVVGERRRRRATELSALPPKPIVTETKSSPATSSDSI